MNVRKRPCEQCPWRRDVQGGQFPADRYEELAATTGERGREVGFDAPIFTCHKSSGEAPMPCAGWLAAVGYEHLGIRFKLSTGSIPPEAMQPGDDWPPLFDNYAEMAAAQSGERGGQSICMNERCRHYAKVQTVVPSFPCPGCKGEMTPYEGRA